MNAKLLEQGACAEIGDAGDTYFFPEKGDWASARIAKRICRECVVRIPCLEYALEHPELQGVWGETTQEERIKLRRNYEQTN